MKAWLPLSCLVICIAVDSAPGAAAAAKDEQPLTVKIRNSLRSRSFAPVPVVIDLEWRGREIIEGRLELHFDQTVPQIGVYRTGPLILSPGTQTIHLTLPAMTRMNVPQLLEVAVRFVTADGVMRLPNEFLAVPPDNDRSLVIAASDPLDGTDRQLRKLARGLRLEQFAPNLNDRTLATGVLSVDPDDLPTLALGYCSYDMVLLAGDGFAQVPAKQLEALAHWVLGGGSVCVITSGVSSPPLDTRHEQFLNDMIAADHPDIRFRLDGPAMTVVPADAAVDDVSMFYAGLGRVVVITRELEPDAWSRSADRKRAASFLWKVNAKHRDSIMESGLWDLSVREQSLYDTASMPGYQPVVVRGRVVMQPVPGGGENQSPLRYGRQPLPGSDVLRDTLMPTQVKVVPFTTVAWILAGFVVLIGPVDYFLLGWLRRRRWTWVLFPCMTVAVTWFIVDLSNRYMGQHDRRRALVIHDIGADGRELRRNRFELVFTAVNKRVTFDQRRQSFTPVTNLSSSQWSTAPFRRRAVMGGYGADVGANYQGRLFNNFTATQGQGKWSPRIHRTMVIEPADADVQINWSAVSPALFKNKSSRLKVRQALLGEDIDGRAIYLFYQDRRHDEWRSSAMDGIHSMLYMPGVGWQPDQDRPRLRRDAFFTQINARLRDGLFTAVAQISPTGGDHFEDLTMLDTTDPKQWLLVVIERRGDDIHVYRRLYRGD